MRLVATVFLLLASAAFPARAQIDFAPARSIPTGLVTVDVESADFDGDGNTDLVAASSGSDDLAVLFGDGRGEFPRFLVLPLADPIDVVVADADEDGNADVVTLSLEDPNRPTAILRVLLGDGAGGFRRGPVLASFSQSRRLVAGDLDEDGHVDVAVLSVGGSDVTPVFGDGSGSFTSAGRLRLVLNGFSTSLSAGDIDGDSHLDLLLTPCTQSPISLRTGSKLVALFGDGAGRFTPRTIAATDDVCATDSRLLDLDGDGRLDVATLAFPGDLFAPRSGIEMFLGTGGGAVRRGSFTDLSLGTSFILLAADLDGDGRADVAAQDSGGRLATFRNDGAGGVVPAGSFPLGRDAFALVAADLDRDGRLDVAAALTDTSMGSPDPPEGTVGVLLNRSPFLDDACARGTVDAASGLARRVLFVNGAAGTVRVAVGEPIRIDLAASTAGPPLARYVLWAWPGPASGAFDVRARGGSLGCTIHPTPLRPLESPQPRACLLGAGMPSRACGAAGPVASPASAPFTLRRAGFAAPLVVSMQGLIEDAGSLSPVGFSTTNAVVLSVE